MNIRAEIDSITPGLRRFARALMADAHEARPDLADDLVHKTIRHAMAHERSIEPAQLKPWLYSAVIEFSEAKGQPAISEATPSPERGGVHHALSSLPPGDRAALLLVTLESFSYADAARVLRISRGALVQRLLGARARFAQHYDARAPETRRRHSHLRVVK